MRRNTCEENAGEEEFLSRIPVLTMTKIPLSKP